MIITLFKKNYTIQFILLFAISIMLWFEAFSNTSIISISYPVTPAYAIFIKSISTVYRLDIYLAFVCLLLEALFLNFILLKNELVNKNNFLPALLYVLLMSHSKELLCFHPLLLANLFIIVALQFLFKIIDLKEAYTDVFYTSFFIAAASLFYRPYLIFIVFVWLSFIIYSLFKWREWLISILGFIFLYMFLYAYYFWKDTLGMHLSENIIFLKHITYTHIHLSSYEKTLAFILSFLILLSFAKLFFRASEKALRIRKKTRVLQWFFFIALFSLLYMGAFFKYNSAILLIPIAAFIGSYLSNSKRTLWPEIFFSILFITIIIGRFFI